MPSRSEELELFKREIDLRLVAAEFGFVIDPKETSRSGTVMRGPGDDKIRISKDHNGEFVYWSARDSAADKGSVIQFVQRRTGENLGEVRKRLRPFVGRFGLAPVSQAPLPPLKSVERNIPAVQAAFSEMTALQDGVHPYLNEMRCLPPPLLAQKRFYARIKSDRHANAVFPHFNQSDGLCGFELKNDTFAGFSSGGSKGLWCSRAEAQDNALVLAESAIDALSHAALKPNPHARYVSIAGQMNEGQPALVIACIEKLPRGEVIVTTDNDSSGRRIAEEIVALFAQVSRDDLELVLDLPPTNGDDWNDVLRAESGHSPAPP